MAKYLASYALEIIFKNYRKCNICPSILITYNNGLIRMWPCQIVKCNLYSPIFINILIWPQNILQKWSNLTLGHKVSLICSNGLIIILIILWPGNDLQNCHQMLPTHQSSLYPHRILKWPSNNCHQIIPLPKNFHECTSSISYYTRTLWCTDLHSTN